jgi:hypothetical protein
MKKKAIPASEQEFSSILNALKRIGSAYEIKKKRNSYLRMPAVKRALDDFAARFDDHWMKTESGMIVRPGMEGGMRAFLGIIRDAAEADALLEAGRLIGGMDRQLFRDFLLKATGNASSAGNLYGIFFGEDGDTMESCAGEIVSFIWRFKPFLSNRVDAGIDSAHYQMDELDTIEELLPLTGRTQKAFASDAELYRRFRRDFRSLYRGNASLDILGYGEMSTVMQLAHGTVLNNAFEEEKVSGSGWVWKKLPSIESREELDRYMRVYREYWNILVDEIGLNVPRQMVRYFEREGGYTLYAGQEKVSPSCVGNILVRNMDEGSAVGLLRKILACLALVKRHNDLRPGRLVGIDGQISNWVACPAVPGCESVGMIYIDTSTPLYRIDGREQLNPEVFLRTTPSFLRWIVRKLFLQEVLDRYYDLRSVIIDIIANMHKEQRPDLIDPFIEVANSFIRENGVPGNPVTREEIDKYYAGDALIWRVFQFCRRVDRFITEKIYRRKYEFRLPGKVKR